MSNSNTSSDNGICMKKMTVGYDKRPLITDINLEVEPGRILTLIGPNGAGKTTVLKTLSRELSAIEGCVYLSGRDMSTLKGEDIARQMATVMTRRPNAELMTCRDVIATGRYPYTGRMGILGKEDWDKVEEAINITQTKDTADREFNRISDGQRQRVMLARAICQEPEILVLDEPTSFLDIKFKLEILTTIRKLAREKQVAVIMSLHELELARGISDIIACVEDDHIGRIGTPDEIFKDGYIQQLYGIEREFFDEKTGMLIVPGWED